MIIRPIIGLDEQKYVESLKNELKRPTLTEVHISDLHFGRMDPKVQYDILIEQFYNKICTIHFDVLSIDGDIFDHKFLSNSDATMYAILFVNQLVDLCIRNNATLVLIHGTLSHDSNQLKIFYQYLDDPNIDIRIVEQTKFEYIKGAKILCIPEEYGKGYDYYSTFLYRSGEYDGVFMHGAIAGAIYGANKEDLDNEKAPVFDINSFALCRGPIVSGHVHIPGCYERYMYYTGSPYRWCFGEEQEKGFMILLHNLETQEHYMHFETIKSFRYDTINLDYLLNGDPKEIVNCIKKMQASGIDNIRVEFTMNSENIEIIKSFYKNNSSVQIKAETFLETKVREENSKVEDKFNKYSYLFDNDLSEYEKLSRYINEQKGYRFITADELIKIVQEV